MPAALPTYQSIIISAMRKLGVLGAGQSAPNGEDLELGVNELNEIVGQLNTRKRFAWYVRSQAFTWTAAQQSYTIGASTNSPVPDFAVTAGNRPVSIMAAQLVLTSASPDVLIPLAVWNWQQYSQISVPALVGTQPFGIYYEPAAPNGVIYPYPAFPSETSNQLKMWWQNQLLTMALSEVSTAINMPPGYERMLSLLLASAMYLMFPKRTDLEELKRQTRISMADCASVNVEPYIIQNPLGGLGQMQPEGGNFLYLDRSFH